jgi:Protein of unknown function (DUF1326)
VDVSGLNVLAMTDTPRVMTEGNWRLGMILDAAASDEPAEKLGALFGTVQWVALKLSEWDAHPVFKTGRAEQPSARMVRFHRRSVRLGCLERGAGLGIPAREEMAAAVVGARDRQWPMSVCRALGSEVTRSAVARPLSAPVAGVVHKTEVEDRCKRRRAGRLGPSHDHRAGAKSGGSIPSPLRRGAPRPPHHRRR